jgi:PTS system galactitol-specific IIA component
MIQDIYTIEGEAANWEEAISMTASVLEENECVKKSFLQACIDREKIYPTGLPTKVPVALPHTEIDHAIKPCACLLRLKKPVGFRNMENPENMIEVSFVLNIAIVDHKDQLDALKTVTKMFQDTAFFEKARDLPLNELTEVFLGKWRD